jgi:hypothetical protein
MGKRVTKAVGIIIAIPLFIIGLSIFIYGMFVPAFVAMPFLFIGILLIVAGGLVIWAFNRLANRVKPRVNY